MRINNKPIKLLVIDEMTALDSATERDILNRILEQREGKTTIIVTHRFASLVKQVDSILYVQIYLNVHTEGYLTVLWAKEHLSNVASMKN